MDGLYSIVELEDGKWFVAFEKIIDSVKYSYLMKVNNEENDFIDEYKVVKSYIFNNEEYMELINDKEILSKIMPSLVPETSELINDPKKLKETLNKISSDI